MIYITAPSEPIIPVRYSKDEAINLVLNRLGYTVTPDGIVYSSSEDGGMPLASIETVRSMIDTYGCLGRRHRNGTYGRPDAAACTRLDRDLFAGSLAPAA